MTSLSQRRQHVRAVLVLLVLVVAAIFGSGQTASAATSPHAGTRVRAINPTVEARVPTTPVSFPSSRRGPPAPPWRSGFAGFFEGIPSGLWTLATNLRHDPLNTSWNLIKGLPRALAAPWFCGYSTTYGTLDATFNNGAAHNQLKQAGQDCAGTLLAILGAKIAQGTTATEAAVAPETGGTTTVFRVEGPGNARLNISPEGNVAIKGDNTLFVNLGDEARAQAFLEKRLAQGYEGTQIKSFEVPNSYADQIRAQAVPESAARQFPGRPFQVDVTKTDSSFGIRSSQFDELMCAIVPGSGRCG